MVNLELLKEFNKILDEKFDIKPIPHNTPDKKEKNIKQNEKKILVKTNTDTFKILNITEYQEFLKWKQKKSNI